MIASQPGIEAVRSKYPDTQIYVAAIDARLNQQALHRPRPGGRRRSHVQYAAALDVVIGYWLLVSSLSLSVMIRLHIHAARIDALRLRDG